MFLLTDGVPIVPWAYGEVYFKAEGIFSPSRMEREAVHLDDLEGFEFEKLVARILEAAGLGKVENIRDTADEGRDLLVHNPSGLIVVECKHQPNGSIGRPVVQKLHSAVISSGGNRGLLITSGRFSQQAVVHAQKLIPPIQLLDITALADLAARVGIELVSGGTTDTPWVSPFSTGEAFWATIRALLDINYEGRPMSASKLMEATGHNTDFIPCFLLRYSVDAEFKTTVGVIHHETVRDGAILLNAADGTMLRPEMAEQVKSSVLGKFDPNRLQVQMPPESLFKLDRTSARANAKTHISLFHTRSVSYTGMNNVTYRKVCQPRDSDILITDVKALYLPLSKARIRLIGRDLAIGVLEGDSRLPLVLTEWPWSCDICGQSKGDRRLFLCNNCGSGSHPPQKRKGHGFSCSSCGMTLCRKCTLYVRRYVLLRAPLCPQCAKTYAAQRGKTPKPFPALRMRDSKPA